MRSRVSWMETLLRKAFACSRPPASRVPNSVLELDEAACETTPHNLRENNTRPTRGWSQWIPRLRMAGNIYICAAICLVALSACALSHLNAIGKPTLGSLSAGATNTTVSADPHLPALKYEESIGGFDLPSRLPTQQNYPYAPAKHFFMSVGLEGSGHHAVQAIWKQSRLPFRPYSPSLWLWPWSAESLEAQLDAHPNNTLFSADSFPMGFQYVESRHPDIPMIAHLPRHSISFIFLERNITACVASATRRFGHNDLQMFLRLQHYIEYSKGEVPEHARVDLRYEWICDNVNLYMRKLGSLVRARGLYPLDFSSLLCNGRRVAPS